MPDGGQYEIDTDVLDWGSHPENVFKRIGVYDFTKKEKKKIEQLDYIVTETGTIYQLSALKNKINELVDAVNLLLDKSTES